MQLALIGNNFKALTFLRQGFCYENLYPDLVHAPESMDFVENEMEEFAYKYKVIVFYSSDSSKYRIWAEKLKKINNDLVLFVAAEVFDRDFVQLKKESLIDSFFIKPYVFSALAGKIRSKIYTFQLNDVKEKLIFRDIELNLLTRELVFKKKLKVILRNKEFNLLRFMIMNHGKVLSRMVILENVWDTNASIFTNTVDVHISRLRKLLVTEKGETPYIQTISCSGYIFS